MYSVQTAGLEINAVYTLRLTREIPEVVLRCEYRVTAQSKEEVSLYSVLSG